MLKVLKTRLALRRSGQLDRGLFHFAKKMVKNEGIMCFYKVCFWIFSCSEIFD